MIDGGHHDEDQPLPRKVRDDLKFLLLTPGQRRNLRDMEVKGIGRKKQLTYFIECMRNNGSEETWTEKGLCVFWQSERDKENAVTDSIRRTRAIAADILADDRQTGIGLEEATAKTLVKAWAYVADALVNLNSPDGIGLLTLATDAIASLSKAPLKKVELGERKESRLQRERDSLRKFSSKVEAGLKQMEADAGKDKNVLAAINELRKTLKAAGE